jgi:hypothetical protein
MTVRDAHGDFDAVDEDVRRGRHGVDEADRVERVLAKERARRARVDEEKNAQGLATRVPHRERHEDAPVDAVDDTTCREARIRRGGEREALEPKVVASKMREVPLADIRDEDVKGGGLHRSGLHRSAMREAESKDGTGAECGRSSSTFLLLHHLSQCQAASGSATALALPLAVRRAVAQWHSDCLPVAILRRSLLPLNCC